MKAITIEEQLLNEESWIKADIRAIQAFDLSVFTSFELETLEKVNEAFQAYSSRQISEYSHQERAWRKQAKISL